MRHLEKWKSLAVAAVLTASAAAAHAEDCGDFEIPYGNGTLQLHALYSHGGFAIEPYTGEQHHFLPRANVYIYDTQEAVMVAYNGENDIRAKLLQIDEHHRSLNHRGLTSIEDTVGSPGGDIDASNAFGNIKGVTIGSTVWRFYGLRVRSLTIDADVPAGRGARTGVLVDYWLEGRWVQIAVPTPAWTTFSTILTNAMSNLAAAGIGGTVGSAGIATGVLGATNVMPMPAAATTGAFITGSGACATGISRAKTAFNWFKGLSALVATPWFPDTDGEGFGEGIQYVDLEAVPWNRNSLATYLENMGFVDQLSEHHGRLMAEIYSQFNFNYNGGFNFNSNGGSGSCNYCPPDNLDP